MDLQYILMVTEIILLYHMILDLILELEILPSKVGGIQLEVLQ